MYLKSLEIVGFKSFSEKVELNFSQGITAIVGPNGCGKSNLVDAIRWGLGEQSAKLMRGSKMEDLLFNGTAQRKALNFAEVSLVLDDVNKCLPLDYHEVVITRRMYRSGEGEYYLNKTPCRLKDIFEIFWDTGIGTETYSLIGQGRVEQIINAKPEERRELFEEAAEIHKYKQKKKETGSRLEETKRNMIRLEDLLAELKNRQNNLSQEADLARKYLAFQQQLKEKERKLFELRWERNRSSIAKVEGESERIKELLQGKKANLQKILDNAGHLAQDEEQTYQELEEKRNNVQFRQVEAGKLRQALSLVQEQKKFAREKNILKKEAVQEVRLRLVGIENTLLENKEVLQKVLKEQELTGQRAAQVQARIKSLQRESLAASREKLKEQLTELRSRGAVLEQAAQDNEQRCHELNERISEIKKKQEAKNQEAEKWRNEEKTFRGVLARLKAEEKDLEKEFQMQKKRSDDFSKRCEEQKEKYAELLRELEKKKGRLKLLRENEEEFLSYAGGVRAVMHAAGGGASLKGIYGPVANLINVSQEYERAIEVALGASLQFIVVEDDRAAREAIAFLKEKKAGRATFLPLNLLKTPVQREIPQGIEGLLGVASKIVAISNKFKKAVDYLLGGVLVAKDLKTALQILRKDRGGWRIVTLDGEMLTPGGAISGGLHSRERLGFLQRKRELASLQQEIEILEKRLEKEKNELIAGSKKLTSLGEELDFLALKQKANEREMPEIRRQLENCRIGQERIAGELRELEEEGTSVEVKYGLLKEKGQRILLELKENREALERTGRELTQAGRLVSQEENEIRRLEEELTEVRIKFSALQEKESACQELIRRQSQEKERLAILIGTLSEEQKKAFAEIEKLEIEEKDLAKRLGEEEQELKQEENVLSRLSQELASIRRAKEELELEKEKEQRSLERAERRYYQLNLEKAQLVEESRYLREHYLEKYGLDLSSAAHFEVNEKEEQLQKDRDVIAERIRALGEVNSGAIEEYERLKERILFLENQLRDLLHGEKGMRKVMAELDREMEKRFLQTLHTVEKNFLNIFTGLFGGGQAFLRLTDPEKVLESGIEIIAQPPGKKLQNISLLSGGEKALTSIALLFSVLEYKLAPFCVLDEIDSSLDESNIERFIALLKRYSQQTQFILITHRQRTMEAADVLYGVTMEEQGISKVLSLNLTKKAG